MSAAVPRAVEHYAVKGCYAMPDDDGHASLELLLLAGRVFNGNVVGLRRIWDDMPPRVKKQRRAFAAAILAGRLNCRGVDWPAAYGICRAHAEPEGDECPR